MNPKAASPKILLLAPSCFYYPEWMERVELKSSLLLLASYINQFYPVEYADFEITIGRPNTAIQIKRYERMVRDFFANREFDILAISCWTSLSYQATLTVAKICREMYPDKTIVVGGYHPSARPEEFVTGDRLIDFIVCREGELALKEIADSFEKGRPKEPVIITGPLFTEEHFVPINWDLAQNFIDVNFAGGIPIAYVYLSRGCPFSCSFCMEPLKEHKWRAFTPADSIKHVFEAVNRTKARSLSIADACFGMQSAWRKEFLRRLAETEPQFWISLETRPEFLDEEDIKLLSHLKVEVQIGIESCSVSMLSIMNKTKQAERFLDKFKETSRLLSEYGVFHRANMIFNHPGETKETLAETFAFIDQELERRESTLFWAANQYMHFPGCACDRDQKLFERKFGGKILAPEWWKDQRDQFEASMQSIPSSDFSNGDLDLWRRMLSEREEQLKATLSRAAFRFAANTHFQHWRNDARYRQN